MPLPRRFLHRKKHLLLADAQAEIYEAHETEGGVEFGDGEILGCAYGHKVRVLGGAPSGGSGDGGGGIEATALAGAIVAGSGFSYSTVYETESHDVWVEDLTDGRLLHDEPSPGGPASIVVERDGAVAWIAASNVSVATGAHEEWVYAADARGLRLLAHGDDIASNSLALAQGTVYWTEGDLPYSARLE